MVILLKNITGEILPNIIGNVIYVKPLIADIQQEDYIKINKHIYFLQDFRQTEYTELLVKPLSFGLPNQNISTFATLEISY